MVSVMPNATPDIGSPLGITDNMEFREKKKKVQRGKFIMIGSYLRKQTNKQKIK